MQGKHGQGYHFDYVFGPDTDNSFVFERAVSDSNDCVVATDAAVHARRLQRDVHGLWHHRRRQDLHDAGQHDEPAAEVRHAGGQGCSASWRWITCLTE